MVITPSSVDRPVKSLERTLREARFSRFFSLLSRAEVLPDLNGLTVLAPTDTAFARLSSASEELLAHAPAELLIDLAEHHLVRGLHERGLSRELRSLQGSLVGDVRVLSTVRCNNGVIHIIEDVACPSYGLETSFEARVRRFVDDHARDVMRLARGPFACDPGFLSH